MSDLTDRIDVDAARFVDTTLFGQSATYEGNPIDILFVEPTEFIDPVDGQTRTTAPAAMLRKSDVASPARSDTLITGGTTYHVINLADAGDGMWRVDLSKDAP